MGGYVTHLHQNSYSGKVLQKIIRLIQQMYKPFNHNYSLKASNKLFPFKKNQELLCFAATLVLGGSLPPPSSTPPFLQRL